MQLDLSDDETAALTRLLRYTLDNPRYPLSPRLDPPQVHSRQARAAAAP